MTNTETPPVEAPEVFGDDLLPKNVFVYGTLRFGFGLNRALAGCKYLGEHTLSGFELYHLGSFPCVIRSTATSKVVGELYRVESRRVLRSLDTTEGYSGPGRRNHYDRMAAVTDQGEACDVYVYSNSSATHMLANLNEPNSQRAPYLIESGDFTLEEYGPRGFGRSRGAYEDLMRRRELALVGGGEI